MVGDIFETDLYGFEFSQKGVPGIIYTSHMIIRPQTISILAYTKNPLSEVLMINIALTCYDGTCSGIAGRCVLPVCCLVPIFCQVHSGPAQSDNSLVALRSKK